MQNGFNLHFSTKFQVDSSFRSKVIRGPNISRGRSTQEGPFSICVPNLNRIFFSFESY